MLNVCIARLHMGVHVPSTSVYRGFSLGLSVRAMSSNRNLQYLGQEDASSISIDYAVYMTMVGLASAR